MCSFLALVSWYNMYINPYSKIKQIKVQVENDHEKVENDRF